MAQFLDLFAFLSVLLRGLALAFEALVLGGIAFVVVVARPIAGTGAIVRNRRWLRCAALMLSVTAASIVGLNTAILMKTTGLPFGDVFGAGFWIAGLLVAVGGVGIAVFATARLFSLMWPFAFLSILIGSVMASHSVARMEHQSFLILLTLLHHLASAAWIGGLPYLLVALRHTPDSVAGAVVTARFSKLALTSVAVLGISGGGLAIFYVGSVGALVGTTYGAMLLAKVLLMSTLLLLGAMNLKIVQAVKKGASPALLPLRRFAEAEVGIGFTILLAAASLTSTPPAIDVLADRVSLHEISQRMMPQWPRIETPPVSALSPVTPLAIPENSLSGSFVPGQLRQSSTPADIAWSEYNHHWAGLVVLAIGVLAVFSRTFSWARHWPFAFLGLAAFLLVRADAENWPLGPHGFWESFQVAEVAQHRLFVLLIVAFAIFEWAVQTRRLAARRAGLVFPFVCAIGGALLMTHSHSLGNVKEEFLAELSHIPLAILAVIAGWSRWLEIRLPIALPRLLAWVWPICFVLIGSILILYREG